jgi:hypothetical protein
MSGKSWILSFGLHGDEPINQFPGVKKLPEHWDSYDAG